MRAVIFVLAGFAFTSCASSGATPSPFPRPASTSNPRALPSSEDSAHPEGLVGTALSLRGSPYRDGGADPSGFDCSGFVAYVFFRQGISVPRTVSEQYMVGARISRAVLEAGDLVFFSTTDSGASHVGIAISGDEFVHAPTTTGVRVDSLTTPYWSARFVGAKRLR
jgi:peptidoglycan DL-endopeptidase CwlO